MAWLQPGHHMRAPKILGVTGQPLKRLKNALDHSHVQLRNVVSKQGKRFCFNFEWLGRSSNTEVTSPYSCIQSPSEFSVKKRWWRARGEPGRVSDKLLSLTRGEIVGTCTRRVLSVVITRRAVRCELCVEGGDRRIPSALCVMFPVQRTLSPLLYISKSHLVQTVPCPPHHGRLLHAWPLRASDFVTFSRCPVGSTVKCFLLRVLMVPSCPAPSSHLLLSSCMSLSLQSIV